MLYPTIDDIIYATTINMRNKKRKSVITLLLVILAIVILHVLREYGINYNGKPSVEPALTEGLPDY